MKPRSHTFILFFLAVVLGTMAIVSDATAEQSGLPFPVVAPGIQSVYRGPRYMDAGIKYMWFETVKIVVNEFSNPGSIESFQSATRSFDHNQWVPMFEIGRQASNYFDLYAGFAWFSVGQGTRFTLFSQNNPAITEQILYNLDLNGYQIRTGGRSWFPLWGLGRFATTLGIVNTFMPYKIDVIRSISAEGTVADSTKSLFWHFAGSAGIELEIGYRSFFGKGQVEATFGTQPKREVIDVVTYVNPHGFTAALVGGFRF